MYFTIFTNQIHSTKNYNLQAQAEQEMQKKGVQQAERAEVIQWEKKNQRLSRNTKHKCI